MMRKTEWKEFKEGEHHYRIRATYGIDYEFGKRHNQFPHFSITGETEDKRNGYWRADSGGCIHDQIARHFPELEPLIKWHLTSLESPMHYLVNGIYWWEHAEAIRAFDYPSQWEKYGSPRAAGVAHFKTTIVFGAIPGDTLPREGTPPKAVREWLQGRLPLLMAAFRDAMRSIGVFKL